MLFAILLAGVFSVWAATLYLHLRHVGLTALALFAPLPFLLVACLLWRPIAASTEVLAEMYAPFCYVLGVVLAQVVGAKVACLVCDGIAPRTAVWQALRSVLKSAGLVTFCFAVWMLAADVHPFVNENLASVAEVLAALAGTSVAMFLAGLLSFTERFIARSNQAREQHEQLMEHLLFVAEPRWSWSLTGVTLIFVALSAFGMRPLRVQADPWLIERLAVLAALVFAASYAVMRNWRLALAETLTLSLLGAFGFWAFARGVVPLLREDLLIIAILLATAAVPLTVFAVAVGGYLHDGDDIASALSRSLQELGAGAVLVAGLSAIPWIILAASGASVRTGVVISVASCTAIPLIFPALAGAIYALLPRYRTVDEVFGKR